MNNLTQEKVINEAVWLFGSRRIAVSWLNTPASELEGKSPMDLMKTEQGLYHVWNILARIERNE
jgi:uncharacterized protein (DUF2384 family)